MTDGAHLSIGEVLALVQTDFPDVTISKIRFLESQGLLDPERTPSGYRKFHGSDIERLQWILGQQRDHFLPLKVIRERLDEWDETGTRPDGDGGPDEADPAAAHQQVEPPMDPRTASASLAAASAMEVLPDVRAASSSGTVARSRHEGAERTSAPSGLEATPEVEATPELDPASDLASPVNGATSSSSRPAAATSGIEPPFTAAELAERAGVSVETVAELESYSMIESRRKGAESYYDAGAIGIAEACGRFLAEGVEVRHLRMYKIAAEREAGMFEQLVVPLLKQRNPESRARAMAMIDSLSEAGESMHAALLRQALRDTLP